MFGSALGDLLRVLLFLLFADLTAVVAAILGPTYDHLLVPELSPGSLYPPVLAESPSAGNYLAPAAKFSTFILTNVVDPAVTLVALGVAVLYLAKPFVARWAAAFDGLVPRLVLAVVAANFTVPIAGALLGLAGAVYPVFAGWDGGAWQHWVNLAGVAEWRFVWDNGVLAFVLSIVEFLIVLALVLAVGVRDALLAVLLVLLPVLTLLSPIRPLAPLARRAWLLFVELAFLPCVLVVPLELAVGSPNAVLLVGYLSAAVASPYFVSLAGTQLVALGFPGASGSVHQSVQRGLAVAPAGAQGHLAPVASAVRPASALGRAAQGTTRIAGSAAAPAAAPLAVAQLVGHGGLHLVRHLSGRSVGSGAGASGWKAVRGGGSE